jgi:hypothetical protein
MGGNLRGYRVDGFTPAMAGKGIAVTGIDDQRARQPSFQIVAAQFNLGRAADIACRYPCYRRAFAQFDLSEIAAIPILVPSPRHALRHAANFGHVGEGQGKRGC